MADIVELITKLGFEVENKDSIKGVTDEFAKQVTAIDRLEKKLESLSAKMSMTTNVNEQQKLSTAILATAKAIDAQTAAAQKALASNKAFTNAIDDEVGKIQQLKDFIIQATKEQATLTDTAQIKRYSEQIQTAQAQLKALIAPYEEIRKVGAIEAQEQQIKILSATLKTVGKEDIPNITQALEKAQRRLKELKEIGKTNIIEPIRSVGVIEAAEQRVKILSNTLKTVGKSDIPIINKELEKAKKNLEELTGKAETDKGSSGGFLSELLGVGSGLGAGKQILQGSLAGLGIGVGFSIIPAITGSLIEYAKAQFDVIAGVEKTVNANEALVNSFKDLNGVILTARMEFEKYLFTQSSLTAQDILLKNTIDGAQRAVDQLAAIGVEGGKVYEAEKFQRDARIKLKEEEIKVTGKEIEANNKVLNTIKAATEARGNVGAGGTLSDVARTFSAADGTGLGSIADFFSRINQGEGVTITERQRVAIEDVIQKSGLPLEAIDKLRVALKSAEDDGSQFYTVLVKLQEEYAAKSVDLTQKEKTQREALSNITIELEKRKQREVFELNLQQQLQLRAADESFTQQELARRETTAETIKKSIKSRTDFELREIEIRRERLRKELPTGEDGKILTQFIDGKTIDIEANLNQEITDVINKGNSERLALIRKYNLDRLQEEEKINAKLLESDLKTANQKLQQLTSIDLTANLDLRNKITDEEEKVLLARNSAEFSTLIQSYEKKQEERRKAGETETQDYIDTQNDIKRITELSIAEQERIESDARIRRIQNIQRGYEDVIKVIDAQSKDLNAAINRSFSEEQLNISEGGGGLFGRGFQSKLADLRQSTAQELSDIQKNNEKLINARKQLDDATKAEKGAKTPEEKKAAQKAIDDATTNINTLETKQNVSNKKIIDNEREALKLKVNAYADAYTEIANIAQNAYNQISEYRQQDIQREISAREKQLSIGLELAKLGNTQVLDEQRNALKQARKEERQAALEQQAINGALQLSYALVAVAKAAAEGGGIGSIATVAAAIGALVTGYGLVRTASQSTQTPAFKDGVIDFDGKGTATSDSNVVRISRGESVMTAAATAKFKDHLKLMQAGIDPYQSVMSNFNTEQVSRGEFMEIKKGLDNVVSAINNKHTSVETITTKDHIATMVKEQQRIDRRKYGQVRN